MRPRVVCFLPRAVRRLAPVAFVATGACFATQNDVRVLQNDLQVLRAEQAAAIAAIDSARVEAARRDSLNRARLDAIIATFAPIRDSLRAVSGRLTRFQGEVRGDLYNLGQQLLQVQTLTGQSAERLRQAQLDIERRGQQIQAQQRADSGAAAAAATPGPQQLFDIGLQQSRLQSWSTARRAFQDLITQYPNEPLAADAQLGIAESYANERNQPAADSVYALVAARYPRSAAAPTAMYKHALSLQAQGKTTEARALIARLRRDHPNSDAATLAATAFPPPAG